MGDNNGMTQLKTEMILRKKQEGKKRPNKSGQGKKYKKQTENNTTNIHPNI